MKRINIKLPDKPGVYFFKRGGTVLYIGKATSLRDRVRSYMSKSLFDMRGPLVERMAGEATKIDYQITDSVLEAIILEANLIKKHQPYYNTKEKSDKSFNYVCITKEQLPKVLIVRGSNLKKISGKIFGPYTSGTQLREAMKIIRKIFPFLDDKSRHSMEFYQQINLVPDLNDRKMYLQNIRNLKLFFEGRKKRILQNLKKEMKAYAKGREFEKAGEIKRQIFALNHINDVALLKSDHYASRSFSSDPRISGSLPRPDQFRKASAGFVRIEAYDIAHMGGKNMVGVMVVVENGEAEKNSYRKFKIRTQANTNDTGALKEILERRLKHTEWAYPNLIVVDGGVAQLNVTQKVLKKVNLKIPAVAVLKDDRHKPKAILGKEQIVKKYKSQILLANSEAHRFAITYHKKMRNRNFLI